jgi:hypothetical protein
VIYTRKSTASDGKSTRDQERECVDWCERNSIPVDRSVATEASSGSFARWLTNPQLSRA